ncbi:hypothetical protein [Salinibacter altiplanensis]|uniref:hypothetical protein n=1 Tax=Salinibacter altiplanensis TaxID=1803181 RepID=UPI000C9F0990|nr:hypothetical protein [Salinibacter altiplanensis]
MSKSSSPNSFNGDGTVPGWMKAVDRDMVYSASPTDATEQATTPPPPSPGREEALSRGSAAPTEASSLDQKLALSMADPSELPEPNPALQPVPAGSVRADLFRQLEKAVSVLGSRYTATVSKSLLLEFALQRTLLELRTQDNESALVQWLDSVLPQH